MELIHTTDEGLQFYHFEEGDKVQLRPNVEWLVRNRVISRECGYVEGMDELIGEELTVLGVGGGLGTFQGRLLHELSIKECNTNFVYNSEWLIPYESEKILKIKGESKKI